LFCLTIRLLVPGEVLNFHVQPMLCWGSTDRAMMKWL
jgi:hypothetical protein